MAWTPLLREPHEIQTVIAVIANIESQLQNAHNLSPQQKLWMAGVRSALSWVMKLPKGGRKIEQFLTQVQTGMPVGVIINPYEGDKLLDQIRERDRPPDPKDEP